MIMVTQCQKTARARYETKPNIEKTDVQFRNKKAVLPQGYRAMPTLR